MRKNIGQILIAVCLGLIPTILIWLPFLFRINSFWKIPLPTTGMATIIANYDGPLYIVAAKSMYDKSFIKANFQFPLSTEYYTAHFPLFPALIKLVGITMNFPYAMLCVTLFSSILAIYFFIKLISPNISKPNLIYLAMIFSIFPARWLIVRSVGSADPLFIASIIASVYYFKNKRYWLAGIWGALAQFTKSPAILLFAAYIFSIVLPLIKTKVMFSMEKLSTNLNIKKVYPLLLIPLALILVFSFYAIRQGDFWAYFHSGDNIHLLFPPFQVFNYSAPWVGTFWLEEIIFIYLIGAIGIYKLFQKKEFEIAIFTLIFFVSILFVAHRDVMRYSLPIVPFILLAFSDELIKKEFKIAFTVILIPIYLFALAFISQNTMPISNWAPFI